MKLWLKAVAGLASGFVTFAILYWGRSFFTGHAAMAAIAVGGLVYSALGTSERLNRMYRRKGPRSVRRRDD
jgi:hypothetical protein